MEPIDRTKIPGKWQDTNGTTHHVFERLDVVSKCGGETARTSIKVDKGKFKLDKKKLIRATDTELEWTGSRGNKELWRRVGDVPSSAPAPTHSATTLPTLPTLPTVSTKPLTSLDSGPTATPPTEKKAPSRPTVATQSSRFESKTSKAAAKALRSKQYHGGYSRYGGEDEDDLEEDDGRAAYPLITLSVDSALNTPSRLGEAERRLLRIVRNVVKDSEYTDIVDSAQFVAAEGTPNDASLRERKMLVELRKITTSVYISSCAPAEKVQPSSGYEYFSFSRYSRNRTPEVEAAPKKTDIFGVAEEQSFSLTEAVQKVRDKDMTEAIKTFQGCLEIGRRYKIANPEEKEIEYGKLLYIAQDFYTKVIEQNESDEEEGDDAGGEGAEDTMAQQRARVSKRTRIVTIKDRLEELGLDISLLEEPCIHLATTPVPRLEDSRELSKACKRKSKTVERLAKKYANSSADLEAVKQVIYALDDRNVGIAQNVTPVATMIALLKKHFAPSEGGAVEPARSLAIDEGRGGSRLTHEHDKQYFFVLQSLTFWKHILTDIAHLWVIMEQDFLETSCPLQHTGQGVNRMAKCPNLYNAVNEAVERARQDLGGWVGSSRVHMGDHQVPNGLHFIDKYTQIPKILQPIINTLRCLDNMEKKDPMQSQCMVEVCRQPHKSVLCSRRTPPPHPPHPSHTPPPQAFGSVEELQIQILRDFFRFGFDGSGGDTDDDAGSCVDGRLTSSWNWCSLLKTKPFYAAFLLSGFSSFV